MNIVKFDFNGHQVGFNKDGWINATEAAKNFGKRPIDWIVLSTTTNYLAALSNALKKEIDVRKSHFGLIITKKGGKKNEQGTWLHPKLAVSFARWLSDEFAVWCDLQIDKLIRSQNIIYTDEKIIALLTHENPESWEKRFKDPFYAALSKMTSLPFNNHIGGTPALFGMITQKWVYEIVLPKSVYLDIKSRLKKAIRSTSF